MTPNLDSYKCSETDSVIGPVWNIQIADIYPLVSPCGCNLIDGCMYGQTV
jgi:hypothetical protein